MEIPKSIPIPVKVDEPVQSSEFNTAIETVKSVKTIEYIEMDNPIEIVEPIKTIESIEAAKPVDATLSASLPIKLFVEDESRFGLMTTLRRRITLKGVKPIIPYQHEFDNTYLYGAVEPLTGDSFFLEFPTLDAQCFQIYIDQFSKVFSDTLNIIILDNGSFHTTPKLALPSNVRFLHTPPYTPEVNPMERVWLDFKDQLSGEIFAALDALFDRLDQIIQTCLPSKLSSLTSYPFFIAACNAIL